MGEYSTIRCKHWSPHENAQLGTCEIHDKIDEIGGPLVMRSFCSESCEHYNGPVRPNVAMRVNGNAVEPCGGCQSPVIIKWLGMLWFGKPWPLRWAAHARWPFLKYKNSIGCGCLYTIKSLWMQWKAIRERARIHAEQIRKEQTNANQ